MPVKPRAHVPQTGAILRSWRLSELGKKSSLDEVVKRLARLGVKAAKSTLSRYENGERVPDLVILRGLAAIYAGLRPCEITRIQADDFTDGAEPTLLVRTAKGGPAGTLPLLPEAADAVRALIAGDHLGHFGTAPIGRVLHRACARVTAALELRPPLRLRPYDLRHSFGTAVTLATDERTAQASLRHASITTTKRYTLRAVPERVRTALRAIDGRKPSPPRDAEKTA